MNWQKIEQILSECTKEPGRADLVSKTIPRNYAEFLSRFDGVEGFVGQDQYLMLWRAEQLQKLNAAYSTRKYLPGVVLIGTDGSDTGFGVDSTGRYVSVPLVGMSLAEMKDPGDSVEEFQALSP